MTNVNQVRMKLVWVITKFKKVQKFSYNNYVIKKIFYVGKVI